jgi:hypothetical protein
MSRLLPGWLARERPYLQRTQSTRLKCLNWSDPHAAYEASKQAWILAHPDAPPREYEQAMRRIANECGV